MVKEVEFNGDELLAVQDKENEKVYVAVRWVSKGIGLTTDQAKRQVKNIREDIILKQGAKFLNVETTGGMQRVLHLEVKYLPIWLSSINRKSLTNEQYTNLIELINWTLSTNFDTYKHSSNKYEWEALLRDEIFDSGYFGNYEVIDKEVTHDYGIIDLLAKDKKDHLIGIELKKDKNYNDVVLQCQNHKKGL